MFILNLNKNYHKINVKLNVTRKRDI